MGYVAHGTSTATKTNTPILDIPQSVTILTKQQLEDRASFSIQQALTYVPGVTVTGGEGNKDAITIRGQNTTADFFRDGVRDDAEYYRDLYNIKAVEVLKGPSALIFGRGGGGGIVNRVTKKEFRGFFSTPAAYLFIGAFLTLVLFMFFWLETFFARNIADVRPLFEWLPLLLIFLVAALTMRSWAEERVGGTIESLLTAPVRPRELVLGKFFASLLLVLIALLLTLPLPVTVSPLGPLDWGPVIGGYVATLFLAARRQGAAWFSSRPPPAWCGRD